MNAEEFVKCWKKEKDWQINEYFSGKNQTAVEGLIQKLNINKQQIEILKEAMDFALTDTYFTLLLGLDGSVTIGGLQHTFKIYDGSNNLISDCGDLEAEAYEQFHQQNE